MAVPVAVSATTTAPPAENPAFNKPPQQQRNSGGARIQLPPAPTAVINTQRQPFMQNCPNCKQKHMTRANDETDCTTIMYCCLLYLVFWPICWIPFVIADCKRTTHYCSNCNYKVGVMNPCCCGRSDYQQVG